MGDIKKPSLKGMSNMGYLGHFAQDKYIQMGHNDVKSDDARLSEREAERTEAARRNADDDAADDAYEAVKNGNAAAQAQKAKDAAADKAKSDYDASPAGRASAYENAPMATDNE